MSDENLQADLIYASWYWEYLRRNEEYQNDYNEMANFFQSIGINAFDLEKYDSCIFDILETNDDYIPGYEIKIFEWLVTINAKHKVFPPPSPAHGLTSTELLEKIIKATISGQSASLAYKDIPRAIYHPYPVSSIAKKKESEPSQPLHDSIMKRNALFLLQNPEVKAQSDKFVEEVDNYLKENFQEKGKYEVLREAPEKIITRDRKIIIAMDKFAKSSSRKDARAIENAMREKIRESLKYRGKPIKQNNLRRAMGLFLWDKKKEDNISLSQAIEKLDRVLRSLYKKFELKYQTDISLRKLPTEEILKKLTRQTDLCISKKDMLPIS